MADRKAHWAELPGLWCDIAMADRKMEWPETPPGYYYRSTHIPRPDHSGLWDRVRKHQVEPHHTHYYSDEDSCWYEIDRSDPYWKQKETS